LVQAIHLIITRDPALFEADQYLSCYQCNRLRLTADGKRRPCLLSDYEIDLRTPHRRGRAMSEIWG
jgi:molybdenum cofactor biosynthesis enzyme MoaA